MACTIRREREKTLLLLSLTLLTFNFVLVFLGVLASNLRLDLHAFPERHIPRDILRRRLRIGVIPRRVLVGLPVHHHVVVGGNALPPAGRVRGAVLEQLALHRFRREIVVSLDRFAACALGYHPPAPGRSCHIVLLAGLPPWRRPVK